MKQLLTTSLILCISILYGKGQEINYTVQSEVPHYIYVGTLPKSTDNTYEKLKVEVFGGAYASTDLGTTTYSIGTRGGSRINTERSGGNSNRFELVAYENDKSYDFVIQVTQKYVSLNIKSTFLRIGNHDEISAKRDVEIKTYNPSGKRNATADFTQKTLTATDERGYLGIGTTSPQSMLDVRGRIIADEVQIKINQGADFVFHPDYDLTPLNEVETFVKQNKHLPEIPSEKEMQEEGLNVNNMQIKLLQKIEELTLYVIELDKANKAQKKLIEELQEMTK